MNVVALCQPPVEPTELDAAAQEINKQIAALAVLERCMRAAKNRMVRGAMEVSDQRYVVGAALMDVQRALKQQDPRASFEAWCAANIKSSRRSCFRWMLHARRIDAGRIPGEKHLKALAKAGSIPQEWVGGIETVQCLQPRSVQTAVGIYRHATPGERLSIRAGLDKIDREELNHA